MNKDLILREKLALQRTVLANQSTLLAFLKTAMYFLIAGISINKFMPTEYSNLIEFGFVIIGVTLFLIGIINYTRHKNKITESEIHVGNYLEEYALHKKNESLK
ncbi:MAG: DUF202 domain-containing protein [Flavobacterium sp.]